MQLRGAEADQRLRLCCRHRRQGSGGGPLHLPEVEHIQANPDRALGGVGDLNQAFGLLEGERCQGHRLGGQERRACKHQPGQGNQSLHDHGAYLVPLSVQVTVALAV